ncbi:polyamine ABC transporter substrate-binding protein [Mesorhizobium sp. SP-1A]|uniref:polyamine ABC transporter substrate-binding protein n=1 Tax=Mesorhizobium sp. SP-1A TaxID=3077840 RepID=UPI0028F732CA|nr:polyamine ABC transporter substrate-binding protein [Mesorhizobium sp. SP-1A]
MHRKAIWLSAATALVALFALGAQAQERVVNVYNWSDYIDQSILADFTKETGIKVVYDTFDSNEILETKLLAGGSGYDVVVPTANFLSRQIQAGVFQKLDKSKLPNLKNMWDVITERTAKYDPGNDYAINYMWGTVGIGYNIDKVKAALGTDKIDSWDVVFKPENMKKLKDCGVHFLDSPTDVIPSALKYLGLDPEDNSPENLQKVEDMLLAVRPYVRKFHSSEYINGLANGDICVAIGWSGDVFQARDRADEAKAGVHLAYAVPKEGAEMWFDMMAIPADAPHVEEAHEFLNFIMKPEVIAKSSNFVYYANGNKASQQFINKDILDDPAVYPDEGTMKKLFTVGALEPKTQRNVTRMWTKVVTGQ